jgi:RHS repeat-associated protein
LATVSDADQGYDALNRLIEVSDPLSRETTYTYDAAGNLDTRTDARGLVTDYAYDSLNRLTNIDYSGSTTPDVTFTYDDVGNRLSMADGTGTTSYVYDALNRLTEVTFPGSRTVDYEYDNAGNRSRIEYPGGTRDVDYTYDEAGRMLTVTDWLSNVTEYSYNDAGYLTLTELPNGVTAEHGYDTADRLTSVVNEGPGGVLSSFTYTLDDVGNRTQVVTPEGTESYTFDDLYRLTGVTYPDSTSESFSYDEVGNRTATAVLAYTYDDADQMLTAGSTTFDYDNNGNQIECGSDTLSYDHENRLASATVASANYSFGYDGSGLRQTLTAGASAKAFTWDVSLAVPAVIDDEENGYVYGVDLIAAIDGSSEERYFSHDALGSVVNLSDATGNDVASYGYKAFGEVRAETGPVNSEWRFAGEQQDESRLHYLRARYYDSLTGRFLSQDPWYSSLMAPVSQNRYPYALGNPTNLIDPLGPCSGGEIEVDGKCMCPPGYIDAGFAGCQKPNGSPFDGVGDAIGGAVDTTIDVGADAVEIGGDTLETGAGAVSVGLEKAIEWVIFPGECLKFVGGAASLFALSGAFAAIPFAVASTGAGAPVVALVGAEMAVASASAFGAGVAVAVSAEEVCLGDHSGEKYE